MSLDDLARDGRRDDFSDRLLAGAIPREDIDWIWSGTRRRLGLDGGTAIDLGAGLF